MKNASVINIRFWRGAHCRGYGWSPSDGDMYRKGSVKRNVIAAAFRHARVESMAERERQAIAAGFASEAERAAAFRAEVAAFRALTS